ncbi:hypothetical protein [Chryseobacterium sp. ISL-6]|uniref:hypothetical protein n=1 Tax=Chryseobacterium sp. ISL-6 TaxID=2819143 RepID=UPI001BE8BE56|nr:hypothetical protein [Chryseobacterium sp. ISL-6]MBT2622448.1 hypothetical protein [Chryseobacterium sp. ISL-6]
MRKNLYLIIILFSLVSCYTYQVKKPADPAMDKKGNKKESNERAAPADTNSPQTKNTATKSQGADLQQTPFPVDIQGKLTPGKNVKIDVDGRSYKVIVDKWESDSLVAHPVRNSKKVLKFHKNQINGERIAEKRFSQPIADIITVAAYAGIGVLIYSLVK